MNNQMNHSRIFWEKTDKQEAVILRAFGSSPAVWIPGHIGRYPVTGLSDYCFAPECRLPDTYLDSHVNAGAGWKAADCLAFDASPDMLAELCGSYPETIYLPDTLKTIGSYAFYNCCSLTEISFGQALEQIGSDAFMNCRQLHKLTVRCPVSEKTCLQRMLAQISWDAEVSFIGFSSGFCQNPVPESVIFYPEYSELYDEITPAHVFGRSIDGEGFRARQAFRDGIVDFSQYDKIFPKASAEESALTVCRLAFCRLQYPAGLSDSMRGQYETYLLHHGTVLCKYLIQNRQLEQLHFLFQKKLLSLPSVADCLSLAVQSGWSEGSTSILHWKQCYYPEKKRSRYVFDDFN
ncbi:MAG: leucine-rich repeat domain-containing protein [Eubacterium sp.]|jgi:hypothetical protein|nr:leucine-rich repeat domain-containing protein [Eubacterium sp.]